MTAIDELLRDNKAAGRLVPTESALRVSTASPTPCRSAAVRRSSKGWRYVIRLDAH